MSVEEVEKAELNLDDLVGVINKNLSEKMNAMETKIDSKLDAFKPKSKEEEPDIWGDDDDDDAYMSKKEIKKALKAVEEKAERNALITSKKVADTVVNEKVNKDARDIKAFNDFPLLNNQTKHFSQKFYDSVLKEMDTRVSRGKSKEDPDLLYDSAAVVYNEWIRKGLHAPRNIAEDEVNERNKGDDDFEMNGNGGKRKGPSQIQSHLMTNMGMSKERFAQIREKYKINR